MTAIRLACAGIAGAALLHALTCAPGALAMRPAACDPAYVDHCVPPPWIAPDLDCSALYEGGIRSVRLARIGWDPHGLDDDGDGYGCEGIWGW